MNKVIDVIKKSAILLLFFLITILLYTTVLWIFKVPITSAHIQVEFGIALVLFAG